MHVSVDTDRCCGAGQCVLLAPRVFDQDEATGLVVLLDADPPASEGAAVREAAAVCPSGAIRIDAAAAGKESPSAAPSAASRG